MTHARSHVWPCLTICGRKARHDQRGNIVHPNGADVAHEETEAECITCTRVVETIRAACDTDTKRTSEGGTK